MKIKKIKIKNFRSYKDEVEIEFGDLTAFVGKNDIGKDGKPIYTLSKGKYLEFHDLDSIVKIGSFSYHVKTKPITYFSSYC